MHAYKDIETSVLLKMIPIEDTISYYGISNLIQNVGIDETLREINEEDIVMYLRKQGYKIEKPEEPCEN